MLKLLHAADFHLDAPFAALPPDRAAERRGEQRDLLNRLSDLAAGQRVDLVLLSGDLLDGGETRYETTQALARALERMRVPVFLAPGNHDFYSARSPYAALSWPSHVHIFQGSGLSAVPLPELRCVVHGAAFTGPYRDDDPLAGVTVPGDGLVHLAVLHGDVGGRGRYGPIAPASITGSGLTYLALGHVHACTGLRRAGETWWAYPGCPEGRGFDETGEKGALLVTLDSSGAEAEFVPLAMRRYEILTADMTGDDPAAALMAVLPQGRERDIFRILLKGSAGALDLEALTALAAPYFYSVTLRDETRPARNLWERLEEDTLTGLFLRQLRARMEESSDPGERERLELAARFGLAALENGEDCRP